MKTGLLGPGAQRRAEGVERFAPFAKLNSVHLHLLARLRFKPDYRIGRNRRSNAAQKRPQLAHAARVAALNNLPVEASSFGAAQHYAVTVETDSGQTKVTRVFWEKTPVAGTMLTDPGVYCLRSNETDWGEERLWRTYMTLTDLEPVFRSLKSELGLRPVYHFKEGRGDSHLFIMLAYRRVQLLRRQLKGKGIDLGWRTLRDILSVQQRVTARLTQKDGRTLLVCKATQSEPKLKAIYDALGLGYLPGRTKKRVN